jgi:hypothetical protein
MQKFRVDTGKERSRWKLFTPIVHCEFIPEGKTLNKEGYIDILPRLRDAQNETP